MKKALAAPIGVCPTCGKQRFRTRKACRAFLHKTHPGESMQVYECGDYWHYGHSPYIVTRGIISRSQLMKP